MEETWKLKIKQEILADNSREADTFRVARRAEGTFMMDVMGSPGAGKTTLLLGLIERLRSEGGAEVGVIEADLASDVDALKMKAAGVTSVELNTKNVCHVEMAMVEQAYVAFGSRRFEYLFLENIGNLVCPAEFDTGCHCRVMLLSVPEGYDKVYKYPPMFAVVDALVVTKCDYLPMNPDFDMEALRKAACVLNPALKVFEVSARTGDGMNAFAAWVRGRREAAMA